MQNIFTLEELKLIKEKYLIHDTHFLCVVKEFEKKWDSYFNTEEVKQLARQFLTAHNIEGYRVGKHIMFEIMFLSKQSLTKKQIRIDFLDWLIKNIE